MYPSNRSNRNIFLTLSNNVNVDTLDSRGLPLKLQSSMHAVSNVFQQSNQPVNISQPPAQLQAQEIIANPAVVLIPEIQEIEIQEIEIQEIEIQEIEIQEIEIQEIENQEIENQDTAQEIEVDIPQPEIVQIPQVLIASQIEDLSLNNDTSQEVSIATLTELVEEVVIEEQEPAIEEPSEESIATLLSTESFPPQALQEESLTQNTSIPPQAAVSHPTASIRNTTQRASNTLVNFPRNTSTSHHASSRHTMNRAISNVDTGTLIQQARNNITQQQQLQQPAKSGCGTTCTILTVLGVVAAIAAVIGTGYAISRSNNSSSDNTSTAINPNSDNTSTAINPNTDSSNQDWNPNNFLEQGQQKEGLGKGKSNITDKDGNKIGDCRRADDGPDRIHYDGKREYWEHDKKNDTWNKIRYFDPANTLGGQTLQQSTSILHPGSTIQASNQVTAASSRITQTDSSKQDWNPNNFLEQGQQKEGLGKGKSNITDKDGNKIGDCRRADGGPDRIHYDGKREYWEHDKKNDTWNKIRYFDPANTLGGQTLQQSTSILHPGSTSQASNQVTATSSRITQTDSSKQDWNPNNFLKQGQQKEGLGKGKSNITDKDGNKIGVGRREDGGPDRIHYDGKREYWEHDKKNNKWIKIRYFDPANTLGGQTLQQSTSQPSKQVTAISSSRSTQSVNAASRAITVSARVAQVQTQRPLTVTSGLTQSMQAFSARKASGK